MGCREDVVLRDKKLFEQILILSLGELGSYLQLKEPGIALSQIFI